MNHFICAALRDLVFVQCKKRERHTWRTATLLKVTLFHGCFSHFLNCTNSAKSCKVSYRRYGNDEPKTLMQMLSPQNSLSTILFICILISFFSLIPASCLLTHLKNNIEISQFMCAANQLSGFCMVEAMA